MGTNCSKRHQKRRKQQQKLQNNSEQQNKLCCPRGTGSNPGSASVPVGSSGAGSSGAPAAAAAAAASGSGQPAANVALIRNLWLHFVKYLDTMNEGEDSDGEPMSLARYARFLELYAALDQAERVQGRPDSELKKLVHEISRHDEDFFGTERCLRCIDKGMRNQVLQNLHKVDQGDTRPGTWVFQPVYPRVLDKLNEQLGSYNRIAKK